MSGREGRSAAAGLLCVGINELKTGLHDGFLVVERHAVEEVHAFGVDPDGDAVEVEEKDCAQAVRIGNESRSRLVFRPRQEIPAAAG